MPIMQALGILLTTEQIDRGIAHYNNGVDNVNPNYENHSYGEPLLSLLLFYSQKRLFIC